MKLLFIVLFSAMTALAQTPEWSRKYHVGSVTCLDFSGDGGKLLSGGMDSTVRLWDVFKSDTLKSYFYGRYISTVDFSSTNWFLVCTSDAKQYNAKAQCNYVQFLDDKDSVLAFISPFKRENSQSEFMDRVDFNGGFISDDDSEIVILISGGVWYQASTYAVGLVSIYAVDSLPKNRLYTDNFFSDLKSFSVASNKRYLHGAGHNSTYFYRYGFVSYFYSGIFDCFTKKGYGYFSDIKSNNYTITATFTQDNKQLLTGNKNGTVYVRNVPEGTIIDSLSSPTSLTTALATDMRGRYYFSAHEDSTLRIWTPGVHNVFKSIKLENPVTTIAVSPDSLHFATAQTDGTVAYWNIDSLVLKAAADSVFMPGILTITSYQAVCMGENAELAVIPQSNFGEELYYQWQKNGSNIIESDSVIGVNSPKLLLKNVDLDDAGIYSVKVISSLHQESITATSQLTVKKTPVLKRPISAINSFIVKPGGYYFTVILFHAELIDSVGAEYQWFKDGLEISGATKSQYYFNQADSALHAGEYTVLVTNQCGILKSNAYRIESPVNSVLAENPFKSITLSAEPNPFKNSTTIRFSLEKPLQIKLAVTDILGREIAVLKDEVVEMGEQNVIFKNENLPQGTYFITLSGEKGLIAAEPIVINR